MRGPRRDYTISVTKLKHKLGFENKAGAHWMWKDPEREIGGRNLYVSIHDPDIDNGNASFSSVAIKTGNYLESIGYRVDVNGNLRLGHGSQVRYQSLSRGEKGILDDLAGELQSLLRRHRF